MLLEGDYVLSPNQVESQVSRLFPRLAYLRLRDVYVCVCSVILFCFLLITEITVIFFVTDEVWSGIFNRALCSPAYPHGGSLLTLNVC